MRKPITAGNWKMNKTDKETRDFFERFIEFFKPEMAEKVDVIVFPPFTSLDVARQYRKYGIKLGGQNLHWEDKGAFTGEISAEFLVDKGCEYVLVGHSERRKYFCETDEMVNRKIKKSLEKGLIPIMCVGETAEERETRKTFEVIKTQIKEGLREIETAKDIVIAYEPVWAIGTGKRATIEQVSEIHSFIRELISDLFSKEKAAKMRIIYGGSVKPTNISELMENPEIDGTLIGGASLDPEAFYQMVEVTAMKGGKK